MPVRSMDIGDVCCASSCIRFARNGERSRFVDQELVQLVQLVAGGQVQVMQQVDDLFVAGVLREVGDVVPDVPQASEIPVDVGDLRVRGDDLAESLVGHVTSFLRTIAARRGTRGPRVASARIDAGNDSAKEAVRRAREERREIGWRIASR